ncbi:MAG: hypothetical protein IJL06_02300 [Kiritimatiellae bacterium]|nr:hypothetical protein [Kiritimatiellia bacterium]
MKRLLLPAALAAFLLAGCGKPQPEPQSASRPPSASPAGEARNFVAERLKELGVRPGFDEASGRIVAVGEAFESVRDPAAKPFAAVRERCLEEALHAAKFDILSALDMKVTVETSETDGGEGTADTAETIVLSVDGTLIGLRMLSMAESWNDGVYEVAVAVGWSKKSLDAVSARLLAEEGTSLSGEAVREWLGGKDPATLLGPEAFVDADGHLRMLGIGAADAETPGAKARAEAMASKCALFSFPTAIKASRKAVTKKVGNDASGDYSEEYDEKVDPKPRTFLTVLSTEAVHPLSGRRMAIAVVEAVP